MTDSDSRELEEIEADDRRHAEVRRRRREEAARRPTFGGELQEAIDVVEVPPQIWSGSRRAWLVSERVVTGKGRNAGRASVSVAMYVEDDESPIVGPKGGWRLAGRRWMFSARQIPGCVPAIRAMFDAPRMLAALRGGGRGGLPDYPSHKAWQVLEHLKTLGAPATREAVRKAARMTQAHAIAALRELEGRGLAERSGGAEFVDDSTARRERRRRGVRGKPLLWAATRRGRETRLYPAVR